MAIQSSRETTTRKAPPHNLEAEQSVLGGILLEKDAINKVLEALSHDGSDFYHDAHAKIFKGMIKLFDRTTPIDVVTLSDLFRGSDELASVGGISYIVDLVETIPTAANIMYYARIVKSKSIIRRMISAATDIATAGYEGVDSAEDVGRGGDHSSDDGLALDYPGDRHRYSRVRRRGLGRRFHRPGRAEDIPDSARQGQKIRLRVERHHKRRFRDHREALREKVQLNGHIDRLQPARQTHIRPSGLRPHHSRRKACHGQDLIRSEHRRKRGRRPRPPLFRNSPCKGATAGLFGGG